MTPDARNVRPKNIDDVIREHLPSVPAEQIELDAARVLRRLRSLAEQTEDRSGEERFADVDPVVGPGWRSVHYVAAAAMIAATVLVTSAVWRQPTRFAVVESVDGALYRVAGGKTQPISAGASIDSTGTVRTDGGAGAMLALIDGSRVEMRSESELALERADDGMRIQLRSGSIIVNAAKQPTGHLYVQTKDMTVSVVGTVFLVNADSDGSRVGVIEGEVRVREGTVETRLRPGQQVSSSPALPVRPLKEEIAWSRNAEVHLAILNAFTRGMAQTSGLLEPLVPSAGSFTQVTAQVAQAPQDQEFEAASIRECDPDNLPPVPEGARGGGANSFQMTPGRTYALCMTLATLIRTAYEYGPADLDFLNPGGRGRGLAFTNVYGLGVEDGVRVRGGPDWVRSQRYTIEAVAAGASDAASMRGPMLRTLLERRFKLKAHVETEQIPAFTMTVASGGLKIKPVGLDACEQTPTPTPGQPFIFRARSFADVRRGQKPHCGFSIQWNGPNQVMVGGAVMLGGIARGLGGPLGNVVVYDKTEITDRFNIILEFVWDENTPGRRLVIPQQDQPSNAEPAATIFTALSEQLGLRLDPAKSPREFIVIDQVERPSPN